MSLPEQPLLEARGLAKSFGGVKAVDDVSFSVRPGELLALIGPNGAGKTTCFNMLNGQLKPDQGAVLLAGEAITELPPRVCAKRGIARTFQITATFGSMSVLENVQTALIADAKGEWSFLARARNLYRDRAMEALETVGMADQAERICGVLAYGDLKRVELAIALASRPRVLLMDEPTAGMAPGERQALMALTATIAAERQVAVLFTEHDMDVVFEYADRIIVLARGRLIAEGAAAAVKADPAVQEVYLGSGSTYGAH
jgi:branched-chain amino acid transport system ATP-binding protein